MAAGACERIEPFAQREPQAPAAASQARELGVEPFDPLDPVDGMQVAGPPLRFVIPPPAGGEPSRNHGRTVTAN